MISKCADCGFPIAAKHIGQEATCPDCGTINEVISQGVTIPTWMFAGGLGLLIGIVVGPAILASTKEGAAYLEKKARERLAR